MDKIKATEITVEKYDFMTASEISIYLGIGRSQAYEIIQKSTKNCLRRDS